MQAAPAPVQPAPAKQAAAPATPPPAPAPSRPRPASAQPSDRRRAEAPSRRLETPRRPRRLRRPRTPRGRARPRPSSRPPSSSASATPRRRSSRPRPKRRRQGRRRRRSEGQGGRRQEGGRGEGTPEEARRRARQARRRGREEERRDREAEAGRAEAAREDGGRRRRTAEAGAGGLRQVQGTAVRTRHDAQRTILQTRCGTPRGEPAGGGDHHAAAAAADVLDRRFRIALLLSTWRSRTASARRRASRSPATRWAIRRTRARTLSRPDSIKAAMRDATPTLTHSRQRVHLPAHGRRRHRPGSAAPAVPNDIERVTITYTWPLMTPLLSPFFPGGALTMKVESMMKNEGRFQ